MSIRPQTRRPGADPGPGRRLILVGSAAAVAGIGIRAGRTQAANTLAMARPGSGQELMALLQAAADSQQVAVLDPSTDVTVERTVEVVQRQSTSRIWGVNGNGAKIRSVIKDGTPVIRYRVATTDRPEGTQSRGLLIQGMDIQGSMNDGPGLMLYAPSASGPLYRAIIRDNATCLSDGLAGLHIKGAVFELLVVLCKSA